jgi:hypothetical protein
VETGFTDGKEVEIVSGLNQGDEVIIPWTVCHLTKGDRQVLSD